MAKGKQARERTKQKKLQRRRRRLDQGSCRQSLPRHLPSRLMDQLQEAHELIGSKRYSEAEGLLDDSYDRYGPRVEILGDQCFLYQEIGNHTACARAAKMWAKLSPRDAEARLLYAQASMFCGRIGVALTHYQIFVDCWPDHEFASKARSAMELLREQLPRSLENMGFAGSDVELLTLHDETLECMQACEFEAASEKSLELLKHAPACVPARNNLALCYFHAGSIEKATHVAEENCQLAPENRFAEAALGRLRFLNGDSDDAQAIADRITVDPPTDHDALAIAVSLLSLLGRDEDVVVVFQAARDLDKMDPRCQAALLHHLAVAEYRLGDQKAARQSWKKCLRVMPSHHEANANLEDIDSGGGHAPWAESVHQRLSRKFLDRAFAQDGDLRLSAEFKASDEYRAITALVPVLLDRGDPAGRSLAVKVAYADGSPEMLEALRQFACSARGPDAARNAVLHELLARHYIDAGPHRVYCRGEWHQLKLHSREIIWEATPCPHWERKLVEIGTDAMNRGDFDLAEKKWNEILTRDPDNCLAAHNLCIVWIERDGRRGVELARKSIVEIHERFPDYAFAAFALAQFVAHDGDFERAEQLLAPFVAAKKLHASEAQALFVSLTQIAIHRRDFSSAELAFLDFSLVTEEDDPRISALRQKIDSAQRKNLITRLFSRS